MEPRDSQEEAQDASIAYRLSSCSHSHSVCEYLYTESVNSGYIDVGISRRISGVRAPKGSLGEYRNQRGAGWVVPGCARSYRGN